MIIKEIPTYEQLRSMSQVKNIFFDMDGTLVNTEPLHAKALLKTLKDFIPNKQYTEKSLLEKYQGLADHFVYEDLKEELKVSLSEFLRIKNEFFISILKESESIIDDRILTLLGELKNNGYIIALVTASEKIATMMLLKKEGLENIFDLILTRDDCEKTKPDPFPYMEALRLLDISKDQAFILEDSEAGVQSAIASGIDYGVANWFD